MLNARYAWGRSAISGLVGYEAQRDYYESLSASGKGLPYGLYVLDVTSNTPIVGGTNATTGIQSLISQANYDYANRYFFTASFRADQSSTFDKANRTAFFPSVSGSWIISNEPFMIRLSEMYFNRAEAEANLGDATSALKDINTVRGQRIDPTAKVSDFLYKASDINASTTALDLVLREKRIELCFESHRFFDLMRYGKDIVRNYWGFHILTYAAGQSTSSLPGLNVDQVVTKAAYPKLIYPIPEQETNNNPLCTQNAGY